MKPIYKPSGKAGEYAEYAINIYTGCTHGCTYCFAESMAKRFGKPFSENVRPRDGILEATEEQLKNGSFEGKTIQLCFTCDPYPVDVDTTATREIIKLLKKYGSHVQILTKSSLYAERDFDLLDNNDWFGVTISGGWTTEDVEPKAAPVWGRLASLGEASIRGIKTWVSCEPVFHPEAIYNLIIEHDYIDLYKIGKLNYHPSDIDWREFGLECERLCKMFNRNYYIKEDLRAFMR